MPVVMAAKRGSPIPSPLGFTIGLPPESRGLERFGESLESLVLRGRHLRTASTEARHG